MSDETSQRAAPEVPLKTWLALNSTVFVAAGCIMTVEVLSTRLVARYLGSSLYTWTSAIGVVLAGIALGNYVGGRLADRFAPRRMLAVLFMLSSIACASIPLLNGFLGEWAVLERFAWPTRILLHFSIAFLMPAAVLGTMSPVVAKMALDLGLGAGRTIGTIYAWSSIGSIAGTFVAGFWLVAAMGTERSILVVAGMLALMGVLWGRRFLLPAAWGGGYGVLAVCALGPWEFSRRLEGGLGLSEPNADAIVFHEDSQYQRVVVIDAGKNQRTMILDTLTHSKIDLSDPLALKYEYEAIYAEVVKAANPGTGPVSALFIGGGGYVFPRYLELMRPTSYLEVSEIDPAVTRAAFEVFGLPRTTSIRSFDMDARNRVSDLIRAKRAGAETPHFDFVFGDAFSDFSVPFHLVTLEFGQLIDELLVDDGVYLLNAIDILESGRLLGALVRTLREVFPSVYVLGAEADANERNTWVLVGSKRSLDLSHVRELVLSVHGFRCQTLSVEQLDDLAARANGELLTDDHAPVENLLTEVVRRHRRVRPGASTVATELAGLFADERYEAIITRCDELLRSNASAALHKWRGIALARTGRSDEALAAFRVEAKLAPDEAEPRFHAGELFKARGDHAAAIVEFRAGLALDPKHTETCLALVDTLEGLQRGLEAETELRRLLAHRPGRVGLHQRLGGLLLARGAAAEARVVYSEALRLDADFPGLRHNLGLACLESGVLDDARLHFQQALDREPDSAALHTQLGRTFAAGGQPQLALESFKRAVELAPSDASYQSNLGLVYQETGDLGGAVEAYRACVSLDPNNLSVMNTLAELLAGGADESIRNAPEAVHWAERVCSLTERGNAQALGVLARAYGADGRFGEAVLAAEDAIVIAQRDGDEHLVASLERLLEALRQTAAER